ncbi:flagellar hook-length control protein FliK [Aureimonas glaciei]|uniref:Flagellar hook-length control protein-like C-terminal domain-containing protein n=1 Tax=Aureimonas glaciei TaxID=1776957 RepID=A0A917DD37_9HYPH|nr:flagellar hook-length control protein FliK [Aureimonas glaciei]GGD27523.1 hypothetical protein GCM10011335_33290 [Aureimonas glaciei]
MKITANSLSFIEPKPAAGGSGDGEYNRMFEDAIRDVAKEPSGKSSLPNDDRLARQAADRQEADGASGREATRSRASRHAVTAATEKATEADEATAEASLEADVADSKGERSAAIESLDRLLNGEFSAVSLASAKSAASAAAVAAEPDAPAPVADPKAAVAALAVGTAGELDEMAEPAVGMARGKVSLEVVHMETHFEPRSDAFVLVEADGTASAKAAAPDAGLVMAARNAGSPEAATPLSADEILAPVALAGSTKAGVSPTGAPELVAIKGRLADVGTARAAAATDNGATPDEADQPRLSFEEALARIDTSRAASGDSAGAGEKRGRSALFAEARADRQASAAARAAGPVAVAASDEGTQPTLSFPSMTGQVANRVIDALGSTLTAQRAPDAAPGDAYVRLTAGGAALKTLTIQLQPEELGRLDVSMRLVEGQLTLEIAATEAGTAKVLAEDREGLRKLLQHAGFSLDDTSITIVTREAGAPARTSAADAAGQAGARTSSGGDSPAGDGAAQDGRQGRESGGGERHQDNRRQSADERARASLKAASTYL